MGESQRRKGAAGERELVRLLPGSRKVSGMYVEGPDVIWRGKRIEVKRRSQGFVKIEKWLRDAQIVAFRRDRGDWMVTMALDELFDLMESGDPSTAPGEGDV